MSDDRATGSDATCSVGPMYVVKWTALHAVGVALTSVAIAWIVSDASALRMLFSSVPLEQELHMGLATHILYSVALWGLIAGCGAYWRRDRPTRRVKVLKLSRGQVMLETLIVLTPFLLLTGGLAQLIVNNIAGMLSHLSAYQAGRTYWVWAQESERENSGMVEDDACGYAHVAAAAVLAPVASGPTDGSSPSTNSPGTTATDAHLKLTGIMSAHFSDQINPGAGSGVSAAAENAPTPSSVADAFDTSPFAKRASQKLKASFMNTDVVCSIVGGTHAQVEVTYYHYLAFPWFSYIFADSADNKYSSYKRIYTLPLQVPPK